MFLICSFRAKIVEDDPTNRFSIGEAFLVKNKNNTETVVVPESVLETPPPPPPPPPQPLEAQLTSRQETIPISNKAKKPISIPSGSPGPFDEPVNNASETSSVQSDVIPLHQVTASPSVDPAKYCKLCDISVTSEMHMRLHLAGAKHAKKLRQLGEPPYTEKPDTLSQCILDESILVRSKNKTNINANAVDSVAAAAPLIDYSVFRTPSGQYYCQVCDLSVTSEITLSQHFSSKRHLKTTKKKK